MATGEDRRGPAPARGLTLIEVLIALGIVLALTAIVLPTASWAMRMRVLEGARDGIESMILQARAHARLNGRSIEVLVTSDRFEARWFDPTGDSLAGEGSGDFRDAREWRIPAPWARRRLPREIVVQSWRTFREQIDPLEDHEDAEDPSKPIRLAILLPDGGALSGTTIVLLAENGDALRVEVDPWTARPLIEEPAP